MKVLQSWKKGISTGLWSQRREAASDENAISLSAFKNQQGDFSKESVVSALSYISSYFSGYWEGAESDYNSFNNFFQTYKEMSLWGICKTTQRTLLFHMDPAFQLTKINGENSVSEDFLDEVIQEKIGKVKKKAKTVMLLHSKLQGRKLKYQTFATKLDTAQLQENNPPEIHSVVKRLRTMKVVIKGPKGTQKRQLEK